MAQRAASGPSFSTPTVQSVQNRWSTEAASAQQERQQRLDEQSSLRAELVAFFQTPCQKWRNRRSPPAKLAMQFLKVALLTLQMVLFAQVRIILLVVALVVTLVLGVWGVGGHTFSG